MGIIVVIMMFVTLSFSPSLSPSSSEEIQYEWRSERASNSSLQAQEKIRVSGMNDLVLSNEYMTIRLNESFINEPTSAVFSSVQSWKYNVILDPESEEDNNDWASFSTAYDGIRPYAAKNISVERNLFFNNATGYRIVTFRETNRFSSLWNISVILPNNRSYFLVRVEISNVDNETIVLDEIASHIHDGIIILNGLRGQLGEDMFPNSLSNDLLYIHGLGEVPFVGTEYWLDYRFVSSKPFFTLSDRDTGDAFTVGFLRGNTSANQVVPLYRMDATQPIRGKVAITTQRTEIPPNETFSYDLFVAIHNNTETSGESIYDAVKGEYQEFLKPWRPSPVVSLMVSVKDSSNSYFATKYTYDDNSGFQLNWLQKDVLISGINDTDNDGNLEVYGFRIKLIDEKDYYYDFIKLDERTGRIEWNSTIVLSTGDYYRYFQFEDLNGDGIKEIIIGKQYNDDTKPTPLQLLILNSTTGETILWYDGGTPKLWSFPIMYDYNKDGVRDVVFYGWQNESATEFRIVSFKNFQPLVLSSFSLPSWGLSLSYVDDFNLDGKVEWLIGGWGSSDWVLLDDNASEIWRTTTEGNAGGYYLVTKELINDGLIVLGSSSYDIGYQYVHLINVTNGENIVPRIQIYGNAYFPSGGSLDLNQDGIKEIVAIGDAYENNRTLYLIEANTGQTMASFDGIILPPSSLFGEDYGSNSFVDIDFDGNEDLTFILENGTIARGFLNGSMERLGDLNNWIPDIQPELAVSPIFYMGRELHSSPQIYYPLPSAPTDLVGQEIESGILLSWEPPINRGASSITHYNIYRSSDVPWGYSRIASTSNTSYLDKNVVADTSYYYYVTAENIEGEGPNSNPVRVSYNPPKQPPDPPKKLTAVATLSDVTLSWLFPENDGGAPVTLFRIYRAADKDSYSLIIGKSTLNHYVDSEITIGKTYYYTVTAVNSVGESEPSNQVVVTITQPNNEGTKFAFKVTFPVEVLLASLLLIPILGLQKRKKKK